VLAGAARLGGRPAAEARGPERRAAVKSQQARDLRAQRGAVPAVSKRRLLRRP